MAVETGSRNNYPIVKYTDVVPKLK